ncbi:hypothetical protein [Methylomonas methanica]|uniref:Antitoxin n=1 Tax=Methylomonas methanica (strain DSM 25384 / MC09) TaxID=857087 RepID=G0A729_METMM|nr:hypothetical protein [Methylomonas methanica]AEG01823.1 hypothetical protein Metme_3455 [Methylomonas methanica MC09]
MNKPQFITDETGQRTGVILTLDDYEELMEDLEDLAAIAERKDEPTISLEELKKKLGYGVQN